MIFIQLVSIFLLLQSCKISANDVKSLKSTDVVHNTNSSKKLNNEENNILALQNLYKLANFQRSKSENHPTPDTNYPDTVTWAFSNFDDKPNQNVLSERTEEKSTGISSLLNQELPDILKNFTDLGTAASEHHHRDYYKEKHRNEDGRKNQKRFKDVSGRKKRRRNKYGKTMKSGHFDEGGRDLSSHSHKQDNHGQNYKSIKTEKGHNRGKKGHHNKGHKIRAKEMHNNFNKKKSHKDSSNYRDDLKKEKQFGNHRHFDNNIEYSRLRSHENNRNRHSPYGHLNQSPLPSQRNPYLRRYPQDIERPGVSYVADAQTYDPYYEDYDSGNPDYANVEENADNRPAGNSRPHERNREASPDYENYYDEPEIEATRNEPNNDYPYYNDYDNPPPPPSADQRENDSERSPAYDVEDDYEDAPEGYNDENPENDRRAYSPQEEDRSTDDNEYEPSNRYEDDNESGSSDDNQTDDIDEDDDALFLPYPAEEYGEGEDPYPPQRESDDERSENHNREEPYESREKENGSSENEWRPNRKSKHSNYQRGEDERNKEYLNRDAYKGIPIVEIDSVDTPSRPESFSTQQNKKNNYIKLKFDPHNNRDPYRNPLHDNYAYPANPNPYHSQVNSNHNPGYNNQHFHRHAQEQPYKYHNPYHVGKQIQKSTEPPSNRLFPQPHKPKTIRNPFNIFSQQNSSAQRLNPLRLLPFSFLRSQRQHKRNVEAQDVPACMKHPASSYSTYTTYPKAMIGA